MSKPTVYMHHGYLVTDTPDMRKLYPDAVLYVRLSDHEAAIKAERQIGFAAAFDVLTYRAANTDNDILAEELDDFAHDLLESAQDWKDRWKQIHKMNEERAADKARIAELEKRSGGLLGLYREAESELKQCVIDRASFSDELRACTESPGGCGYWREAAKHRTGERDHALARIAELEAYLALAKDQSLAIQAGIQLEKENTELLGLLRECREALASDGTANWMRALIARIDAALAQQGKEGEA
jgi:hypothetical protein